MKKLILIMLMFLALINVASAVVVYGEFENGLSSATINRNQETTFNSVIFSNNPPINYDVKMYNANGDLIKTYISASTNNNYVSNRFTITRNDYQIGGIFTITINAIDSLNDNDLTSLRLEVINNAPILNPIGNKVINESELLQFTINASDPDNDSLSFRAENLPRNAILIDNNDDTASFSWQTGLLDSGSYDVNFIVDDGQLTDNEVITINVIDVPFNPFIPTINIIKPVENEIISGMYNILWQANDLDQVADTLDIRLEYGARSTTFISRILNILGINLQLQQWIILEDAQDNNDGIFTWDTTQVSNGNYELRATVTDDNGNTAVDYVSSFIINNIIIANNPPVITSVPITQTLVNQPYSYDVDAIDIDNDVLNYSLLTNPVGMNINANTGLITWLPGQIGFYNVVVSASDSRLSDTQNYV
ncbi:MAG: Ig domain-containing protein, partial [Nanoarchaeota archaeon]